MKILLTLILAFLLQTNLKAESRLGIEAQGIAVSNNQSVGLLIGIHDAWYLANTNVYAGFSILTGSSNGTWDLKNNNLTYFGGIIGHDSTWNIFHIEQQVLVGYGYGPYSESVAINPTLGAGLIVVDGWRAIASLGYLYMPGIGSGGTFSIKLDRKTDYYNNGTRY